MSRESFKPPEPARFDQLPDYEEKEISSIRERQRKVTAEQLQEREAAARRRAELVRLDEERARHLAQMIEQVDTKFQPTRQEAVEPVAMNVPKTKPGILSRWSSAFKQNRFIKAALVAVGLHMPLTPAGQRMLKDAVEHVHQARTEWEKPGMVITPQSQQERDYVVARIYEQGARSDAKAAARLKDELGNRLDQGQEVPLDEMYFKLAKTSGEDPERIKEAKRRKDELVERLAARMKGEMSDAFIRSVVDEMYGPDSNYVWGQGSVTEYFLTGKRNCVAAARAEQMVFESLLAKLPPEKRKLYQIGLAMEKQHEIATISVMNGDGTVNRTIYLQPPVKTLYGAREQAGSPTVPMETIKRAMVSKTPIVVKSPEKPGETIADSPDIDTVTDDPVQLNLKVDGKLRGSDYVAHIAEDRGIKPVKAQPEKLVGVQELEVLKDEEAEKKARMEKAKKTRQDAEEMINVFGKNSRYVVNIDAQEMKTAEEFRVLNEWQGSRPPGALVVGEIADMDDDCLEELARSPALEIRGMNMMAYLDNEYMVKAEAKYGTLFKKISERQARGEHAPRLVFSTFYAADVGDFIGNNHLKSLAIIYLHEHREEDFDSEVSSLEKLPVDEFYLDGIFSLAKLEKLSKGEKMYHIGAKEYLQLLIVEPNIVKYKNIKPWVNEYLAIDPQMLIAKTGLSKNPEAVNRLKTIIKEAEAKYGHNRHLASQETLTQNMIDRVARLKTTGGS